MVTRFYWWFGLLHTQEVGASSASAPTSKKPRKTVLLSRLFGFLVRFFILPKQAKTSENKGGYYGVTTCL